MPEQDKHVTIEVTPIMLAADEARNATVGQMPPRVQAALQAGLHAVAAVTAPLAADGDRAAWCLTTAASYAAMVVADGTAAVCGPAAEGAFLSFALLLQKAAENLAVTA